MAFSSDSIRPSTVPDRSETAESRKGQTAPQPSVAPQVTATAVSALSQTRTKPYETPTPSPLQTDRRMERPGPRRDRGEPSASERPRPVAPRLALQVNGGKRHNITQNILLTGVYDRIQSGQQPYSFASQWGVVEATTLPFELAEKFLTLKCSEPINVEFTLEITDQRVTALFCEDEAYLRLPMLELAEECANRLMELFPFRSRERPAVGFREQPSRDYTPGPVSVALHAHHEPSHTRRGPVTEAYHPRPEIEEPAPEPIVSKPVVGTHAAFQHQMVIEFLKKTKLYNFQHDNKEHSAHYDEVEHALCMTPKGSDVKQSGMKAVMSKDGSIERLYIKGRLNPNRNLTQPWLGLLEKLGHKALTRQPYFEKIFDFFGLNCSADIPFYFELGRKKYRIKINDNLEIEEISDEKSVLKKYQIRVKSGFEKKVIYFDILIDGTKKEDKIIPIELQGCLSFLVNLGESSEKIGVSDLKFLADVLKDFNGRSRSLQLVSEPDEKLVRTWRERGIVVRKDRKSGTRVLIRDDKPLVLLHLSPEDQSFGDEYFAVDYQHDVFYIKSIAALTKSSNVNMRAEFELALQNDEEFVAGAMDAIIKIDTMTRLKKIPERYLSLLRQCLVTTLQMTSEYDNGYIKVLPRGLREIPQYHLHQLYLTLKIRDGLILTVRYLDEDLSTNVGQDGGALRRQFCSILVDSLIHDKGLQFSQSERTGRMQPLAPLKCGNGFRRFFSELGGFFIYVYKTTDSLKIGSFFDDHSLTAPLKVTSEDLQAGIENVDVQLNILHTILDLNKTSFRVLLDAEGREIPDGESIEGAEIINLLLKQNPWSQDQVVKAKKFLRFLGQLQGRDMTIIPLSQQEISRDLVKGLLDESFAYSQQISPIFFLAEGMKRFLELFPNPSWDLFRTRIDFQAFCKKIQGSLDRNEIARAFVTQQRNPVIDTKIGHLKEYVLDPATTDEDVRNLLLYFTGCAGYTGTIRIDPWTLPNSSPFPRIHACFRSVEICPNYSESLGMSDRDKGGFINCIKKGIQEMTFTFG